MDTGTINIVRGGCPQIRVQTFLYRMKQLGREREREKEREIHKKCHSFNKTWSQVLYAYLSKGSTIMR
jgi:hypothetical protein